MKWTRNCATRQRADRWLPWLLILVATVSQAGCAAFGTAAAGERSPLRMQMLYGTDRAHEPGATDADEFYGKQRGVLQLGAVDVELDRSQGRGFVAEVAYDSRRNLRSGRAFAELLALEPLEPAAFSQRVRQSLDNASEPSLLIYVHGYSRTYDEAVKGASLLVERVGFNGVPVVWSWPSLGNPAAYVADATNMHWSIPNFDAFLALLTEVPGLERVIIIAHSMGTEGVTRALARAAEEGRMPDALRRGELILIAPDIDADIFERDLAPRLLGEGLHITLYASSIDQALWASRTLHTHPRIGDTELGVRSVAGVAMIDVTPVNASYLGHTYHERSAAVLRDIAELLDGVRDPALRTRLVPQEDAAGTYWRLQ